MDVNKYMKIINGNRSKGYKIAMWNCRRGLVDSNNLPSEKFTEILKFIESRSPHLFCIVESDLHNSQSRIQKHRYLTTEETNENMKIKIMIFISQRHGVDMAKLEYYYMSTRA